MNDIIKIAVSVMTITLCSCSRSTQKTAAEQPPKTQTSNNTGKPQTTDDPSVNTDLETSNANTTDDNVVAIPVEPSCFDSSAKPIDGQFQNKNKNLDQTNIIDCYDAQGNILYKGTTRNCLEEMQIRFGPDVIFPSQQMFPKQYEAARTSGAGGQAALKQMLSSSTCAELKAKE